MSSEDFNDDNNIEDGYLYTNEEGHTNTDFPHGGSGEDNNKGQKNSKKSKPKDKQEKRNFIAYKYSNRGKDPLHEAIVLEGKPCFIYHGINSKSFIPVPVIEVETRVIRPPNPEEYPYTPYEFKDEQELHFYYQHASKITSIGELYRTCKQFWKLYIDQDDYILVTLASDAILSYFQDLFPAIHYIEGVGDNDVGKSSIGYTFEYTGYRVIRGVSISGANYIRILGNVEPGQCTIVEDEGDSISEDPDKVKILKSGYELNTKCPKTNINTVNQETKWFYPYCIKMILAEKSLSQYKARGLVDRTFTFKCRPGKVKYSIKSVVSDNIRKNPELARLCKDLIDFRKLTLCYRLIHYTRDLREIETSLSNRDLELTEPTLQLFYGSDCFEEIKQALAVFVYQRKQRKSSSIEAVLYQILKPFVNEDQTISEFVTIQYSQIWNHITLDGAIAGKSNEYKPGEYESTSYGTIYRDTLSKIIADKFGAELIKNRYGSVLKINVEKFRLFDRIYSAESAESESMEKFEIIVNPKSESKSGPD